MNLSKKTLNSSLIDDDIVFQHFSKRQMGNSNHVPTPSRFIQLKIEESELLSSLLIVQDPLTKQRFMAKQLSFASQQDFSRVLRELKARQALSSRRAGQYLIQIKDIQTKETGEICGKNFRIIVYLEYLEGTLKTAFCKRQRQKRPYSQEQVKELMRTVVCCLIALHDNSFKNVHLYKEALFLSEQGSYKLVDTQISNRIHPYFELLNSVPTKPGTYLAPELLSEIRSNSSDFFHTPKADIFTLAVLAIELMTLNPQDCHYDYSHMQVSLPGLLHVVEELPCTEETKSILQMMLMETEQERIGLLSLKELLSVSEGCRQESAFRSASTSHPRKNTTRTFISRSKPESRTSKASSVQKLAPQPYNATMKKETGKDLSTQRQIKAEPVSNYASNKVVYQPIETTSSQPAQQRPIFLPPMAIQPPIAYQVKDTPRSSYDRGHFNNKHSMRQFQTPVNLLYQQSQRQEPESTPIRKVEILNSLKQKPAQTIQQSIPKTTNFSAEYFAGKTYGQHVFSNGAKYQGEFNSNNQFQGNGMLYYPGGKLCYSGSWQANSFHGFGVLYNEHPFEGAPTNYLNFNFTQGGNWDHYQGQFDHDCKEGFGTLYFSNGDKFSGCFKGDAVEGFGTFFLATQGRHINGIWTQNVLNR